MTTTTTLAEPLIRVKIDTDEWYPVYEVSRSEHAWGTDVDMPAELVERIQAVHTEWVAMQNVLESYYRKARGL